MIYSFTPIKSEALPKTVSIDGYMKKDGLLGPFRMDGEIVYYDPAEGKLLNPKSNSYVRNTPDANL